MPPFHETKLRVRYAETDQWGTVYHSNFFIWFEVGRVELFRQLGFSYKQMEIEDESHLVVAEASCGYKRPARYDDVLRIRTRIVEAGRRIVRSAFEVVNDASGELLATGETTHVVCDRNGRAKGLTEKYRRMIAPLDAGEAAEVKTRGKR